MDWSRQRPNADAIGRAGDGEGGYLASATDLMIGLLFVFIILVVVLALEQQRQAGLLAEQQKIQEAAINEAKDPRGEVTNAIGEGIRKALSEVRIDPENGVISLPEDVLFAIGSADLSTQGRAVLGNVAERLVEVLPCYVANQRDEKRCQQNPRRYEVDTVFIEGHTDNRPMMSTGYDNTNLSLDRARAVNRAIVQSTPLLQYRNKAHQPLFSFSAYGDTRPLPDIDPSDARNRRVDLRIVLTYQPIREMIPELQTTSGEGDR